MVSECLICNKESTLLIEKYTNNYIDYFSISYCCKCDFIYSKSLKSFNSKILYDAVYTNITKKHKKVLDYGYDRYLLYTNVAQNNSNKLVRKVYFYRKVIELLNITKKHKKVLDYGCGMGYFVKTLRDLGFNAYGTDISSTAISLAKVNFISDFLYYEEFVNSRLEFDIIILNDTLGHVQDPVKLFRLLISKLSIRGQIIINTPRKHEFQNTLEWIQVYPPDRFLFFSESSLHSLASVFQLGISFLGKPDVDVVIPRGIYNNNKVSVSGMGISVNIRLKSTIKSLLPSRVKLLYYKYVRKTEAHLVKDSKDIIAVMERIS